MIAATRPSRARWYAAIATIALSALALSNARPATAQTPAPAPSASVPSGPIAIDSCSRKMLRSGYGLGGLTLDIGHGYNFFNVSFTNRAKVAATRVVFQIDFDASRYVIADAGSYAPGVKITHTLRDRGKSVRASARPGGKENSTVCAVLSAQFADGTTWATPTAANASATP